MPETLPEHHEIVTFTRMRWREVLWSLLDQRGDSTAASRSLIWTMLELTRGGEWSDDLPVAMPTNWADTIRWWEKDRTGSDPAAPEKPNE